MPEVLRIAYLVSRYPATNHTFILREIVALRSLGFDIKVIAIRGADRPVSQMTDLERLEQQRTVTILPFGKHFLTANFLTAIRKPDGYLAGLLLALKLGGPGLRSALFHLVYFLEAVVAGHAAKKDGFRHLHSHFSSTVALIAARVFGFGLSMTVHGPDEFKDVVAFGMRRKVAAARFISTISQYARSQIMLASDPADWGKIEICRLGVDPAVFVPGVDPRAADPFRLICVGRLAPVKAQQILIAACAQLVSKGYELKLHIIGSGPDANRLREFAASVKMNNSLVFEGARNQDEVIALYRQSDLFALASFAEGVPVVLMEAMAMEIPCVATWVNGIPELIRNHAEGLLVAPSDVEGLASTIERLMKDPELRRQLGRAARQKVLDQYDLQKNASQLAGVFQKYLTAQDQG